MGPLCVRDTKCGEDYIGYHLRRAARGMFLASGGQLIIMVHSCFEGACSS